jgi:hypothetical protein
MIIYLSGGMKQHGECEPWQNIVMCSCPKHIFLDPRTHSYRHPVEYSLWDCNTIKSCDMVLAYMEVDNPSGYGLSFEVGYALGKGKLVWMVDARQDYRMGIVRCAPGVRLFSKLEDIIDELKGKNKHGIVKQNLIDW